MGLGYTSSSTRAPRVIRILKQFYEGAEGVRILKQFYEGAKGIAILREHRGA